ncbi:hypothetical protein L9F63_008271, partial [Diploptera punctata]
QLNHKSETANNTLCTQQRATEATRLAEVQPTTSQKSQNVLAASRARASFSPCPSYNLNFRAGDRVAIVLMRTRSAQKQQSLTSLFIINSNCSADARKTANGHKFRTNLIASMPGISRAVIDAE